MDRWAREDLRRGALDWLVPVAVLVVGVVNVSGHPRSTAYPGAPLAHLAFLAAGVVLLGLRRRAPLLAPLAAIAVVTCWTALMWPPTQQGPFEGFVVLVGAAYSLGSSAGDRRRLAIAAGALVAFFVLGQVVVLGGSGGDGDLLPLTFWMTAAFAIGVLIRSRTHQAHEARAEVARAAAEQETRTNRAVEEERSRIARELHDVVAHALSVIVVQAGVERRTLSNGTVDVEAIDAALGSIETAGREALVDLRRLLGLLRRTGDPLNLAPQPGLGQVEELLGSVRETGVAVDLVVNGEPSTLPAGLDLTAYRIVQEALTNVLKHAEAHEVTVGLTFAPGHLEIEVTDDGQVRATPLVAAGDGHGLIGMRERASVFGGEVVAGPRSEGGWLVRSRLPLNPAGVR